MSTAVKANAIATDAIYIKGAALNNLKNIDVIIPRNQLVLITGLSGSGKSSLAFDTLYAEGQRRYVESLSSYARQFLGRLSKPKVEFIKGITPAIAITQKVTNNNPRSTVGTTTEIYEYLKLLFARIGKTFDPKTGKEIKKHSVTDVIDFVKSLKEESRLLLLSPLSVPKGKALKAFCESLSKQGFSRIKVNGTILRLDDTEQLPKNTKQLELVIDRSIVRHEEDFYFRLGDAIGIAFYEGHGVCTVEQVDTGKRTHFSNIFGTNEAQFPEPDPQLFSFNNPYGACPTCEGFGDIIGLDEDLVIPNTDLSVYEGAIAPWRTESMTFFKSKLIENAHKFNFPVHTPWHELSEDERELIWTGNEHFYGLNDFFEELESKAYKIQNRVLLSRYRGRTRCKTCKGGRLRKEATYVKVDGHSIEQLSALPIDELLPLFKNLNISEYDRKIAERLLLEINNRLQFMHDVGLGYLSLNRKSNTLSGGESQRINLATSLGSSLVGSTYILDEPS
ncbi:MAG: excinuclease ABC subunit A, partial [Flavobacteriaceae bacterium]|nr:excinuclease ABC subunit A [Flavobacteriaceae bacterium]